MNAQGGFFGNALQAALFTGNTEIAQLLLDNGAYVTFVRQLHNSRLQRYRRFLKGVPALNDKRSIRGSYRLIRQVGLNDNEID